MLSQNNTQLNSKEIYEKFFKQTLHDPLQKVFELKEKTDIKRDFYWEHSFSMDEKVYVKVWETSYKGAGKHPNPGFFKNLPGTLFEVSISDSFNKNYYFKLGDELYYNEAEKDIKEEDNWKIRTCDSIYFTILVVKDGKVVSKPNFFLLAAKKKHNLITMTNDNVFITEQKNKNKITNKSLIKRVTMVEVEKELSTTTVDSKKKKRKQKKSKHKKEENSNEKFKHRKLDNSTGNQLENSFYHNESSSPVPLPQSCGSSNTSSSTAFTTDEFDPVNDNKPLSPPMHQLNIKDHHCLTNSEDYSSLCTTSTTTESTSPTLPPFNTDPGYFDFHEGIDTMGKLINNEQVAQRRSDENNNSCSNLLESVNCDENSQSNESVIFKDHNERLFPLTDLSILGQPEYQSPHSPVDFDKEIETSMGEEEQDIFK